MTIPAQVTNVQVADQFDSKHVLVSWVAVDSSFHPLGYYVYRGNVDDFTKAVKVNATLVTIPQLLAEQLQGLRENWYYFVTCVNLTGASLPSVSVLAGGSQYTNTARGNIKFIVPEIIRRRRIMLDLDGEDGYILIKKVSGTRCTCWDSRRASGLPDCPACYGTYYDGGYVKLTSKFRITSQAELMARQELGRVIEYKPRGWLVTYPIVKTSDVLVRKDNKRMRIINVTDGRVGGVLTRIAFDLQELEPSDPVYAFPVT